VGELEGTAPSSATSAQQRDPSPVGLLVPHIFEPALCRRLIELHDADGGRRSGFTRMRDGVAVSAYDDSYKIRSDYAVTDPALRDLLAERLRTRLLPEMARALRFRATRTERWLVTCYDGARGGFIRAHRDNASAGVAHRVFSCTINLNAGEYEGGELRFPEQGARTFRPPTGGAIVFGSSLLHEVIPVTRGRRYAFVTFFYDEECAVQRRLHRAAIGDAMDEEAEAWTSFAPLSEAAATP